MAQSQRGPEIEIEATWQTHYIKWAEIFGIPDPYGPFQGYQQTVEICITSVQCGINYNNKQLLHLAMVRGYAKAVNMLFKLQKLAAELMDQNNMTRILFNNLMKEEAIARQQSPLDNSIFAELGQMSETILAKDMVHNLLFNIVALGRYIGPPLSKCAQTNQDKVDVHTYPSGNTVVKAFVANNFISYEKSNAQSKNYVKHPLKKLLWSK
jgi:hypothetical protein